METEKIGVLTCRKVGLTCTGAGCLKAFHDKEKGFERYKDRDAWMAAFFDCSGCGAEKMTDPGFTKKLQRIKEIGIESLHLAQCITKNCPQLDAIKETLDVNGIHFVEGTH